MRIKMPLSLNKKFPLHSFMPISLTTTKWLIPHVIDEYEVWPAFVTKPCIWNLMAQKFGHRQYSPLHALQIAQSLKRIGHNLQKHENKLYSDEDFKLKIVWMCYKNWNEKEKKRFYWLVRKEQKIGENSPPRVFPSQRISSFTKS